MVGIFYVYLHTFSNGLIYIGKGKGKRIDETSKRRSLYWNRVKEKYGLPSKIKLHEHLSEAEALRLEVKEISIFKEQGFELINHTLGGGGSSGFKMSQSAKDKISESRRGDKHPAWGRPLRDSHKLAISFASKGKKPSDKAIEKSRLARLDKPLTLEHRTKLSNSHKGKLLSVAHKEAISHALKGRCMSEDSIQKMLFSRSLSPTKGINTRRCAISTEHKLAISKAMRGRKLTDEHKLKLAAKKIGGTPGNTDFTQYHFFHPLKGLKYCTQRTLRREENLSQSHLASVVRGERKRHLGWECIDNKGSDREKAQAAFMGIVNNLGGDAKFTTGELL